MSLEDAAARWLEKQPAPNLRIAREIITRRADLRGMPTGKTAIYDNGVCAGLRIALAALSDRPGDISSTGAEGYIADVEQADQLCAEKAGDLT